MPKPNKETTNPKKRGYTLYLDTEIIDRLESLAADPNTDRSPSWLVNSILREKMGMIPEDAGGAHE